jgi:hypothetical protein
MLVVEQKVYSSKKGQTFLRQEQNLRLVREIAIKTRAYAVISNAVCDMCDVCIVE